MPKTIGQMRRDKYGDRPNATDLHYEQARGTATDRGYGPWWRRRRLIQLKQFPLCRMCQAEQRITPGDAGGPYYPAQ